MGVSATRCRAPTRHNVEISKQDGLRDPAVRPRPVAAHGRSPVAGLSSNPQRGSNDPDTVSRADSPQVLPPPQPPW